MAENFTYRAVAEDGKIINSTLSAQNKTEAYEMIKARNQQPINIEKEKPKPKSLDFKSIKFSRPKVKVNDLSLFCKQLSTMLGAGISLSRALDIQIEQTENNTLKEILSQVSSSIKRGIPLSKSMKEFPKIFPSLLLNMIEAGEMTGNLDEVLARMYVHFDKENKINNKVKGAMVYPMVLGILTICLVIGMLVFVMPTFVMMFEGSGVPLPGLTQALINLSNSMVKFWYIYIASIVGGIYGLKRYLKTASGKRAFDLIKLNLPVVKKSMQQLITTRFTRTLSTLLSSGISVIRALEISTEVVNNTVVSESMEEVMSGVKKGMSLGTLLKKVSIFPPMMVSMVGIGEETGAVDDLLAKTADYYDGELESTISRLVALLEPLMILVMGGAIGTIVIALMMPMFDMFGTIK